MSKLKREIRERFKAKFTGVPPYLSDRACDRLRMIGVRRRRLKAGDVVTVHHCHGGYLLPDGLPENSVVTVVSVATGYDRVVDANGREFTVSMCCIDAPDDGWWRSGWIDRQTHRDGAQAFAYWLDNERAEMEEGRWREFVS